MMMKNMMGLVAVLVAVGLLMVPKSELNANSEFEKWYETYGDVLLEFASAEDIKYRMNVFNANLDKINQHNSHLGKSYEVGVNQFTIFTQQQFEQLFTSTFTVPKKEVTVDTGVDTIPNGPIVDWVTYGAVSPVKNQGACTATYAFSAIGAIQGLSVIVYKNQQQYSVQQLIDCSQSYGNNGCASGLMTNSFSYIISRGINTWAAYPYVAQVGVCKTSSGIFKISGFINVGDCITLANALVYRPISVAVDASNFASYRGGIFSNCGYNLGLAALLVGMTDDYWKLKLSWGTTWGQQGYIRLARGNTCGVCQAGTYPTP